MSTRARSDKAPSIHIEQRHFNFRMAPITRAIALALAASGVIGQAQAQQAFSSAWYANKGVVQSTAQATGYLPNGTAASTLTSTAGQKQRANEQLQRSISNLNLAAQAIAAQQAAQAAARLAAASDGSSVPDGLTDGGLEIDTNSLTKGWLNAKAPVQTTANGKTTVAIEQTADKAILNWETFNVGRNTTVDFQQQKDWAVLNRVNDPLARPSQILGQIKGDGTVLIVNRNGIIFNGTSQVNTHNLVAAAANITDNQFSSKGLYFDTDGSQATFTNALGKIEIQAGAQITTDTPKSSIEGGGYVLLLGREVANAGEITTPNGQTVLAAGDSFYIRKGVGTDSNSGSTTRGNEVSADLTNAGSNAGKVLNTGLITATIGDITLTGHEVVQDGVAVATTSTSVRGTIHLSNRTSDASGTITLAEGATTAIVLDTSGSTALDSQRDAALEKLGTTTGNKVTTNFNNLSSLTDRTDLSRIEIVSGNTVEFQNESLTLATGGEIAVSATKRTLVNAGAQLDVSGAVGVSVSMESNNIKVNVQGNEQRDSSTNRDSKNLNNSDVWIDSRTLVYVPAGTNGYATDRWYTAGGLLEVSGYLANDGHSVGEWMAQGGTVTVSGGDLITRAGSRINLSGGTLDVATGYIKQSWLKGSDGQLYEVSSAPGDLQYTGLYQGFEQSHARWGVTDHYYNPLIAPQRRLENGYTVGRDAGKLVVATNNAVLEGEIISDVYQGDQQTQAAQAGLDGYYQSQYAVARAGQLIIGSYKPIYDADAKLLRYVLTPLLDSVTLTEVEGSTADGVQLNDAVAADRQGTLVLDSSDLNAQGLGAIRIAAKETIAVDSALEVVSGGEIVLYAAAVDVAANLTAHSGTIRLGNVLAQPYVTVSTDGTTYGVGDTGITVPTALEGGVKVHAGVSLDASGLQTDLRSAEVGNNSALAYVDGGTVSIRSTESVTLESGSLIDVSSGATVLADGSVTGGTGGNVQLGSGLGNGASSATAVLTLDGTIRGYGVKGGGTLDIESASAISIGGKLVAKDGVLQAGESSLADLILLEDVEIMVLKGGVLPVAYSYVVTKVLPGEVVGSTGVKSGTDIVITADWLPPLKEGSGYVFQINGQNAYRTDKGIEITVNGIQEIWSSIPAGSKVQFRAANISPGTLTSFVDYVVPANVFSGNYLPINARTVQLQSGDLAPYDVTLTLKTGSRLAAGTTLATDVAVGATTTLSTDLFQTGFAQYNIRAHNGLVVADGVSLEVTMPVLQANVASLLSSSGSGGSGLEDFLQVWLPDLYQETYKTRTVSQRGGASLSLAAGAGVEGLGDGDLVIGTGASLRVDPGQSIELSSRGSLTVDGLLQAKGGDISLLGPMTVGAGALADGGSVADGSANQRAITLGEHAVLDVSAASYVTEDEQGQPHGLLTDGGSITIGGTMQESGSRAIASDAFVVIKQGALVNASGGQAQLNLNGSGTRTITSNGGSISIASDSGLYLDGTLRAEAGGAGASGGTLVVALEAPNYLSSTVDNAVLAVRELTVVQQHASGASDAGGLTYGHATLGVDQVEDGGFSSLTLYSNGALSFGGDVNLALGKELRLYSGALAVAKGVDPSIKVSLSAPYVLLAGITDNGASKDGYVRPSYQGGVSTLDSQATLTATADLLDIKGTVTSGLNGTVNSVQVERAGFDQLNLISEGDLRFVAGTHMLNNSTSDAELDSTGDILLRAAQVYPATGVKARVLAGRADERTYDPEGRLVIERYDATAADPALPYSVFGSLLLGAATIEQNGVLRAPLGSITLGTDESLTVGSTNTVTLGTGSLTSVSADGLVMPYGGTADDVTWYYLGKKVGLTGIGDSAGITLSATDVTVKEGALLDLSGGGELQGAGFVSGRGGSTDARYHPLVQVSNKGFTLPSLKTNPVYAIVPGYASSYAPADSTGAVDPLVGQQITIKAGDIPGLAAGTYTLLPSSYALLPGAYRVEINGAASGWTSTSATAMRNGSYSTSGTISTANTGISNSLSSQLIITSADVLRTYSQYNETSYAEFVQAQAKLNGTVRAGLPADAKSLTIRMPSSSKSTLTFDGLADFTPAKNGYGGTASILTSTGTVGDGAIEILADTALPTVAFDGLSLYASDLNAIGAARLTVGGSLGSTYGTQTNGTNLSNYVDVTGQTGSIVLREGAILKAPEVFLVAANTSGGITIETGAGINTIGMGEVAYDSTDGYIYRPGANAVVAASNGWLNMLAPEASMYAPIGSGPIAIGVCGATCTGTTELYSQGTLLAATLSDFEMSDSVRYGTRNLVLAVGTVNAGSEADLAAAAASGALTSGLTLNQSVLNRLLQGDTAYGAPALERLVLTAAESVNFFGNVSLDTTNAATGKSTLDNLVLSTPAIYGYGSAGDVATITTGKLTWAGLAGEAPTPVSGGRGTGSGTLKVNAGVIEFGYDSTAQPNGVDDFARTILGFANVQLNATDRITANQKGSLSVYQSQVADSNGLHYEGGNLTLTAPLITGAGGSVNRITAGGTLQVLAPASGAADAAATSLAADVETGAELNLTGNTVRIDTTVALPSGKLTVTAEGDIVLGDSAWLDLSGREIVMYDTSSYSWGGDVTLRSNSGNITQAAGSTIDLSAQYNNAGLLTATALAAGAGIVDLQGTLLGSASGHYDAGGTLVPYRAGGVDISAQHLGRSGTLEHRAQRGWLPGRAQLPAQAG